MCVCAFCSMLFSAFFFLFSTAVCVFAVSYPRPLASVLLWPLHKCNATARGATESVCVRALGTSKAHLHVFRCIYVWRWSTGVKQVVLTCTKEVEVRAEARNPYLSLLAGTSPPQRRNSLCMNTLSLTISMDLGDSCPCFSLFPFLDEFPD